MLLHVIQGEIEFLYEVSCSTLVKDVLSQVIDIYNSVVKVRQACLLLEKNPREKFTDDFFMKAKQATAPGSVSSGKLANKAEIDEFYAKLEPEIISSLHLKDQFGESLKGLLLSVENCGIWLSGKEYDKEKPLSARTGTNEKTRVKISLTAASSLAHGVSESHSQNILGAYISKKTPSKVESQSQNFNRHHCTPMEILGEDEALIVDPKALEKLRNSKKIKDLLKNHSLQERLKEINHGSSSFILQELLDKDQDLRDFFDDCLEEIGALTKTKLDDGSVAKVFDGGKIIKKKE